MSEPTARSKPIEGVGTSIAAFVGLGSGAPARRVRSFSEYEQASDAPELTEALRLFFAGGGREAWVGADIGALDGVQDLALLALPGEADTGVLRTALAYVDERRAFLLVDPPDDDPTHAAALVEELRATGSANAAVYFPRLTVDGQRRTAAPSGAVAAVYVRTELAGGVWATPAGIDATVIGAVEPAVSLGSVEASELNDAHVNAIRAFSARGIVVWGSRTIAQPGSEWTYVPVRRLALYLERSLDQGLEWATFEPNDDLLWANVRMRVDEFLHRLFKAGAFAGRTSDEAYFVKCGEETMTQDDIADGRLVVLVGFAALEPAEFVLLRIGKRLAA